MRAIARPRAPAYEVDVDGRQDIIVSTGDTATVVDDLLRSLKPKIGIYQRGGMLVHVVERAELGAEAYGEAGLVIRPLTAAGLREILERHFCFVRVNKDGIAKMCSVPKEVLAALLERHEWRGVPVLVGVSDVPVLRDDGTIAEGPGYDAESGMLLVGDDTYLDARANELTYGQAIADLLEVVEDFPFREPCDRSAWAALVLTLVCRAAINGPVPLFLVESNVRGSGKSRLVDAASIIATGRPASRATQPADEAEAGKLYTSILMGGDPLLLLDNVSGPLGGAKLDALLTGERWSDRALGGNTMVDLPIRVVVCATSNNPTLVGDLVRRVLPIRLASDLERPEDREDFRHHPLLPWVREQRHRLVSAALIIASGLWTESAKCLSWGSFEAWAAMVPRWLIALDLPNPMDARVTLEDNDPTLRALEVVYATWGDLETACGSASGISIGSALAKLYQDRPDAAFDDLREALEALAPGVGHVKVNSRALAHAFRKTKDRVIGGRRLRDLGKGHGGLVKWGVR